MQGKTMKKAISVILSLLMVLSLFTGITVTAEDTAVYEASRITIHPGIDETRLNFSWHSEAQATPATVRIKEQGAEEWTVFTGESAAVATSESGHQAGFHDTAIKNCGHTCSDTCGHPACSSTECYHGIYASPWYNRVTVSGLTYGTTYTYQLGDGTNWSQEYTTQTADTDPDEGFQYLVFGDTQTADQYYGDYMKNALELALERFPEADFMMNLGDNIHENNDRNYNAYFTSQDILAQNPIAVVMGNHELNIGSLTDHPALTFTNPPDADDRQDYWFRYGDVLFITFNSGPQTTAMMEDLDQLLADATKAHPDARWKILQTHQGFYSNNGGGKVWRRDFVPVIDKYDIDMVFVGHHHLYTRTESIIYPDSPVACEHDKSTPDWNCETCSGYIEELGENDVTVDEVFVATDGTETEYTKTVERTDPEGITYMHLDSLTAEGHDQYYTGSSSLAPTSAYSVNTISGQGAISLVTVTNDALKVETYWIHNNGTPRIGNSADITLLDDDYIDELPYDSYTIRKTSAVKEVEVTFDGGSDRGIFTRRINSGEAAPQPENPVLTGKSFVYWSADGETEFDFTTPITEDITLTAVYEEIPPTTTAALFKEAVARGDSEIVLAADITLPDEGEITISSNTVIKSAEGQQYTLTLDGSSRLTVAAGKTVTLQGINIVIAATANTISDSYNNGSYITVGSGGSRASLYIYDCKIEGQSTALGSSTTSLITSSKNASSYVYMKNTTVTSAVTGNNGALFGGYATYRAADSTLNAKTSSAWFCTSSTKIILDGTTTYVGWKHTSAKLYDFRDASVKAARNPEGLIELSKIGSGTAVSSDNYKIYYSLDEAAFENGTAIEYTEPIAGVDYVTPIYVSIRYTDTTYYSTVAERYCGEYVEGVAVATADAFVAALADGVPIITLTSDIILTDLGNLSIGADTVIQSKTDEQFTITLDGSSRLTATAGKKVTLSGINVIIAETADQITDEADTGNKAYYYGYITVRNGAKLYIYDCNIESKSTDLGSTQTAMIKIYREAPNNGYVHIERSAIVSPSGQNKGIALGAIRWTADTKPCFRIVDSTITGNWIFYQGYHILEGTTVLKGTAYSTSDGTADYRGTSVKAFRNLSGSIELSKIGSGTAVSSDSYKIYYSFDESAFENGTAIEYTEPIADVDYTTPLYVAIGRTFTYQEVDNIFYSTYAENILDVITGDVNNDESVNATDLATFRNYFLGEDSCDVKAADANGDDAVDARDLVRLKKYIVTLA